jgi:hypothetical protein
VDVPFSGAIFDDEDDDTEVDFPRTFSGSVVMFSASSSPLMVTPQLRIQRNRQTNTLNKFRKIRIIKMKQQNSIITDEQNKHRIISYLRRLPSLAGGTSLFGLTDP